MVLASPTWPRPKEIDQQARLTLNIDPRGRSRRPARCRSPPCHSQLPRKVSTTTAPGERALAGEESRSVTAGRGAPEGGPRRQRRVMRLAAPDQRASRFLDRNCDLDQHRARHRLGAAKGGGEES